MPATTHKPGNRFASQTIVRENFTIWSNRNTRDVPATIDHKTQRERVCNSAVKLVRLSEKAVLNLRSNEPAFECHNYKHLATANTKTSINSKSV
jgi:hypothetical protein